MDNKNIKSYKLVEEYENHPTVKRVITGETTFRKEILNFYDSWDYISFRRTKNSAKIGTVKKDLVDIISEFTNERFDIKKLSYEAVRQDYKRWHGLLRQTTEIVIGIPAMLVGGISFVGAIAIGLFGNDLAKPYIPLLLGTGLAGVGSYCWAFSKPRKSNDELEEYKKLYFSALEVDSFIRDYYNLYFIRKIYERRD